MPALPGKDYVAPNTLVAAVQATYDYEANRDDELTFKKGDYITNVKTMPGWFVTRFSCPPTSPPFYPILFRI